MGDARFNVIFTVDTGCARAVLVERDGIDPMLIDTMKKQGLLQEDKTGWVKVSKGGWNFWKAYLKKQKAEVPDAGA